VPIFIGGGAPFLRFCTMRCDFAAGTPPNLRVCVQECGFAMPGVAPATPQARGARQSPPSAKAMRVHVLRKRVRCSFAAWLWAWM